MAIISIHVQQPIGMGAEIYIFPSICSPLSRECEDIDGGHLQGLVGQKELFL